MNIKDIKQKLREFFFVSPMKKIRVRSLARELVLPLPSVIRYVKELEAEGFIKKTVIGGVTFFSADRVSKVFLLEKRLFNIRSLYNSGIIEYIVKAYGHPVIILFGSYAKGEDVEESDIDLFIESEGKKSLEFDRFEKMLQRKIQVLESQKLKNIKNKELANNILNGVVVYNYIEVF